MKYGYVRVSTLDQKLENKIEQLTNADAETIVQEKLTGTTKQRPEFQTLLTKLELGDTLIVPKLNRFARNTKEALKIIQELFQQNVTIHILNIGLIDNTATGQLIFSVFSQFERALILERTQEGKRFANGLRKPTPPKFREGRPRKYSQE